MHLTKFIVGFLFICATTVFSADPADSSQQKATVSAEAPSVPAADSVKAEAAVPSESKEKSATVEESEENLILDGGEESLLPTMQSKPVEKTSVVSDSLKNDEAPAATATTTTDSLQPENQAATAESAPQAAPISPVPVPTETEKPLQIEQTQSINFAKNFKEYRNPKTAILLSLLVPGAGQAYAHDYFKTGIFGAVEISMITVGTVLRYTGSQKWKKAQKFADNHYTLDKFNEYYSRLVGHFTDTATLAQIFEPDSNADYFLSHAGKKDDEYYNSIRDYNSPYVHGWDDAAPGFDDDFNIVKGDHEGEFFFDEENPYLVYYITPAGDTTEFSRYGFSQHQTDYNDKLSAANNDYRWSQRVFTMLLINHIASAIDALITAKAYNDRLLGKKTAWQRINLHDTYVQTPKGTAQGLALEVRF